MHVSIAFATIALLIILHGFADPTARFAQTFEFNVPAHGDVSVTSSDGQDLTVGYARIQAQGRVGEYGLPGGMAIYSLRQNGVLVSEASVPSAPLVLSGRIFTEISAEVNTGIAIANPNARPVTIDFYFTDASGKDFGEGSATIGANQQISGFFNEAPFNAAGSIQGTFTFISSWPVSAIALRCLTNERSEFLMTTLPVAPVVPSLFPMSLTVPHFADGGGWKTVVVLVNPTDATITGELRPYAQNGQPLTITLERGSSDVFGYSIPPRSSATFRSGGAESNIQVGSMVINPASSGSRPDAFVIFRYSANGVTTTETSVPAAGGQVLSMFVESVGDLGASGSIQSGIAVAGSGIAEPMYLHFELYRSDGTMIGQSNDIEIPAHWQASMFLNQISGLPPVTSPFEGVLRIVASGNRFGSPGISVTGLRGRYNERGDFLITTTAPIAEVFSTSSSELLFPHFAVGAGYETQFVLFTDIGATGTVRFFDQAGNPLNLPLQ